MNDIAIRIEHVSKQYKLGVINTGTFFRDMQSHFARKMGKPDPNAKLGNEYYDGPDSFWALKDVSFDIKRGDRIGIIGKNGAGKSTLLKLISRISAPTEGCIKINGRVASLLEVGTGFHKELTGRENIYLNGSILGMKKRQIDRILDEIIDFSGIEQHIDTPVKRYSSGMFVRLGFAVAAHLDSEILIADEVLAVGDAKFQEKAIGKMNAISAEQGRTVIFVSHNIQAVHSLCNVGAILDKGSLIKSDDIDTCIRYYNNPENMGRDKSWTGSDGDGNLVVHRAELYPHDEIIDLLIEFEIKNPDMDYVLCVQFFNNEGRLVCVNSFSDIVTDEEYAQLRSAGNHSVMLQIDTSIFAQGEYYIEFDFAIHCVKRITTAKSRVYFEVFNQRNHRHPASCRENTIEPIWQYEIQA